MRLQIIVRIVLRERRKLVMSGSVHQETGGSGASARMGGEIEKDVMRSGTVRCRMRSAQTRYFSSTARSGLSGGSVIRWKGDEQGEDAQQTFGVKKRRKSVTGDCPGASGVLVRMG